LARIAKIYGDLQPPEVLLQSQQVLLSHIQLFTECGLKRVDVTELCSPLIKDNFDAPQLQPNN
jgi:hypothetical protein